MVTPQQKAFCVLEFAKMQVQRAFRTEFGIDFPDRKSIRQKLDQCTKRRCLCKEKSPGRTRVSEEQMDRIYNTCERSPRKSLRRESP